MSYPEGAGHLWAYLSWALGLRDLDGEVIVSPHDLYLTTGETVGTPAVHFPDCGLDWHYAARPVHLASWPVTPQLAAAPYTTVSHWWGDEWVTVDGKTYNNDKRFGFLDYLDLPAKTSVPLELALLLDDDEEIADLERRGWRIRNSWHVAPTPEAYAGYIRGSRGEFSCAKPSCAMLANPWVSDRT